MWCGSLTTTDASGAAVAPAPERQERGGFLFAAAIAACVAVGLWLRLEELALKPLHHDESVNGWFTLRLDWWNVYRYRPADYHGPFLYYVNLFFFRLLGPTETALRLGTVLAGAALPLAVVPLRKHLGSAGTFVAAILLAVSPGIVYFSRTSIHEIYLLLFTLIWVGLLVRWLAEPSYRLGLAAAAICSLSFCTKETTVITGACLFAGLGLALLWGRPDGPSDLFGGRPAREALDVVLRSDRRMWLHGAIVFGVILAVLFSSFFTYGYGIGGFFQAFYEWSKHGVGGRNQSKSWDYFATVAEWTMLWLPYAGAAIALFSVAARRRFGLFLTGWTATSAIAYSLIPYKTPWCGLNIDLPLILLLGWGTHQAMRVATAARVPALIRLGALLTATIPALAVPEMIEQVRGVNADDYDDDDVPYVFVQTQRGIFECVDHLLDVERARADRVDDQGPRVVNLGAKNPIRWYTLTRGWNHDRTTYAHDEVTAEEVAAADVVITTSKEHTLVEAVVEADGDWHLERCRLRPGHRVSIWWRSDDWASFIEAGGESASRAARSHSARPGPPPSAPVFVPPKPEKYRSK
jgi:uncharacterized protein (TIGR03663 family)